MTDNSQSRNRDRTVRTSRMFLQASHKLGVIDVARAVVRNEMKVPTGPCNMASVGCGADPPSTGDKKMDVWIRRLDSSDVLVPRACPETLSTFLRLPSIIKALGQTNPTGNQRPMTQKTADTRTKSSPTIIRTTQRRQYMDGLPDFDLPLAG